jgi:hypothetical protein
MFCAALRPVHITLSLPCGGKRGRIRCVKYWKTAVAILAALSMSLAVADDFKTTGGKEYKNATVTRVEPDGIVIKFSGGIVKLTFGELPEELQKRYAHDAAAARTYTAQETQKQPDSIQQQNADADRATAAWRTAHNIPTFTLQQLEEAQFHIVGTTVAVAFNYRGTSTRRVDDEWFSGTILRHGADSAVQATFADATVLVPQEALGWYQTLPTSSSFPVDITVYARVEENSGGTVLRLLGTRLRRGADGGPEIAW